MPQLTHQRSLTEGEGLSTVGLLILHIIDQFLFILEILFTYFTKQATLMRRSNVLRFPTQLVFPGCAFIVNFLFPVHRSEKFWRENADRWKKNVFSSSLTVLRK
jgi:hypothetical protein